MTVEQARDLVTRSVGAALRKLRAEHGLTRAQLAAQIGTTEAAISGVERGKRALRAWRIALLCDLYGLRVDEVMIGRRL